MFIFLGFVMPTVLKPIQKVWMALAILMGYFVTGLILFLLFYLVVTPLGLLMRLFGKDVLKIHLDRKIPTYWVPREECKFDKVRYEKQF